MFVVIYVNFIVKEVIVIISDLSSDINKFMLLYKKRFFYNYQPDYQNTN